MRRVLFITILFLALSCKQKNSSETSQQDLKIFNTKNDTLKRQNLEIAQRDSFATYIPKGFVLFEKINGDLNSDGIEDCVLIIKATEKSKIITDENRGLLDRNRRGIIVLFSKNNKYELAIKNYDCFSSENEDDGAYFAPELSVEIKDKNLYINYGHGRYGHWGYRFRFENSDFNLIGYDAAHKSEYVADGVTFDEESINFLSKKKLIKTVVGATTNEKKEFKEVYKENWKDISINKIIKLSEIKDFIELDMGVY